MSDVVLSASVRQNLLSLQSTADLLATTQNRLATGKKVNTALDNPTNYFTAAGLDARASDINNLLDGIGNVSFHVADLFADSRGLPWAGRPYDRVLLDPPRAGAREVLPIVSASGAGRVLYISCHPGSLARDAGILVREHGFRLTAAGVMDMFPHTTHVEALAVFER